MRISRLSRRRGFSFLEIMLVVAIIGILVSLVGPKISGHARKSRLKATRSQIKSIETALGMFEIDLGCYPTTEQGLTALVTMPTGVDQESWSQYMERVPLDSFKESFIYRCPGENDSSYDLISKGPDRKEGTEDDLTRLGSGGEPEEG